MAARQVVLLVDDLTQEVLPEGHGESLIFAVNGTSYEIDLSHENAEALRQLLNPYVQAARRVRKRAPLKSA